MDTPSTPPVLAELHSEGILRHIAPQDLESLKFYGTFAEYSPGEIVIQEGIVQDCLYYVVAGTLDVITSTSGTEVVLGHIGKGDCIGEISIFEPGQASATVRVQETSVLWYLNVTSLQSFFEAMPSAGGQLMLGIAQLLSKRLRNANQVILTNRVLPKHLAVRSGKLCPITAETVSAEENAGLFGIFSKKQDSPKISTDIKM